jgi:hypothetical protein
MTPTKPVVLAPPAGEAGSTLEERASPAGRAGRLSALLVVRLLATALLVGGYYAYRAEVVEWLNQSWAVLTGTALQPSTVGVLLVTVLMGVLVALWRKTLLGDPRFHAPLLVTVILVVGDAAFGILEGHTAPGWLIRLTGGLVTTYSPTLLAILATIGIEMVLGRFYYGKWPHPASAYITGISVGILIKSPSLWPFILCGVLSIVSKYVLRVGNRHLWNPSNFGVTMMLFLAPEEVASLTQQAGNTIWAVLVIWCLGGMIMYRLGRFHIPLAFLAAFIPLAFLRSAVTGNPWEAEIGPITGPMFQLYIFFMITDPKTTPRARWAQTLLAVVVALLDTGLRLAFKDKFALYHALFIAAPVFNLVGIWHDSRRRAPAQAAGITPAPKKLSQAGSASEGQPPGIPRSPLR